MKPYVYIIQNKDRTQWYVGYKQKPKAGEDYWGSSKYLDELIEQTGKENWTKTIIKEFDTWQEAKAHEDKLLELMWDLPGRVNKARNGYCDHNDPEVKAKLISGTKKAMERIFQDPEYRAKHKAASQKRAQDPVWQAKHKAGIEKMKQDPVWQANTKAANQKRYEDPDFRAKHKAATNVANKKKAKPFIATNIITGEEFYCESGYCEQVKALGLNQGSISAFLRGTYPCPNYKGYTFRYA